MRVYFSEVESNEEEGSTNIISTSLESERTKTKSELEGTKSIMSEKTGLFSNNSTFNPPKQSNTTLSNIPKQSNTTLSNILEKANTSMSNITKQLNTYMSNIRNSIYQMSNNSITHEAKDVNMSNSLFEQIFSPTSCLPGFQCIEETSCQVSSSCYIFFLDKIFSDETFTSFDSHHTRSF